MEKTSMDTGECVFLFCKWMYNIEPDDFYNAFGDANLGLHFKYRFLAFCKDLSAEDAAMKTIFTMSRPNIETLGRYVVNKFKSKE